MKSIDELKQEQYDLKAKLHEIIEFINGEEYANLTPREKGLINQQRAGMEMYLDALTKRIYKSDGGANTSSMWLPLLMGMFTAPWTPSSSTASETLDEKDFEDNDITDHAV